MSQSPFGINHDGNPDEARQGKKNNLTEEETRRVAAAIARGQSTITIKRQAYSFKINLVGEGRRFDRHDNAPFLLTDKTGRLAFIPVGHYPDSFLLGEVSNAAKTTGTGSLYESGLDIEKLLKYLSRHYSIPDMAARVKFVLQHGALINRAHSDATYATKAETAVLETRMEVFENHSVATFATKAEIATLESRLREEFESRMAALQNQLAAFEIQQAESQKISLEQCFYCHSITTEHNNRLRSGQLDVGCKRWAVQTSHAMRQLEPSPGRVYRGLDRRAVQGIVDQIPQQGYKDRGFTCTSRSMEVAMNFALGDDRQGHAVLLVIDQHTGRYIAPYVADDFAGEEEVLLFPNTQLYPKSWNGKSWEWKRYQDDRGIEHRYLEFHLFEHRVSP